MKKNIIRIAALSCAVLMCFSACQKERHCKCVATDGSDNGKLTLITVAHSMKCSDITQTAIERRIQTGTDETLERLQVHPVSCRDYDK